MQRHIVIQQYRKAILAEVAEGGYEKRIQIRSTSIKNRGKAVTFVGGKACMTLSSLHACRTVDYIQSNNNFEIAHTDSWKRPVVFACQPHNARSSPTLELFGLEGESRIHGVLPGVLPPVCLLLHLVLPIVCEANQACRDKSLRRPCGPSRFCR